MSFIKSHFTKGCTIYKPVNYKKVKSKSPIICRSSWEETFCKWCDYNPNIIEWDSECLFVKYRHPFKKDNRGLPKISRYYPDFFIVLRDVNNDIQQYVIEVKPFKECSPPKNTARKKKSTYLREQQTWKVNESKWKSAQNFCNMKGYTFKIITEKELFGR